MGKYDQAVMFVPESDLDDDMNTKLEDLNLALDAYAREERDYEERMFAASCSFDASDELPF